jgi:L-rhamnose mutarotase
MMERVCFTLRVRKERMEEYRARHRAVWAEMLDALREAGWENYSLFLRPDGLLVGYFETRDFERAMRVNATEVNERWQREMAPFFDFDEDGGRADRSFERLEQVFYLGREEE